MFAKQITSPQSDRRLLQWVCFGGAPVVFACFALLMRKVAADAGEMIVGILCAAAVAIGMVVLGMVGSR
jgi:hypothetical protein